MSRADDTAAIVAWKEAPPGRVKAQLLETIFRAKHGLIRSLTAKAARQERSTVDDEDLMQAGFVGFRRGLEGFDPSRGNAISTYAAWWVRHEVQSVTRADKPIALPRIRLTNDERAMVLAAILEDPDVDPETLGVARTQFEQVKASFGLRFVSDALPAGSLALERCMHERSTTCIDMEEEIDRQRELQLARTLGIMVQGGATAEECGLSDDEYAAFREYIRTEERETMTENQAAEAPKKKREWTPAQRAKAAARMAERRAKKAAETAPRKVRRAAATEVHKAAPNVFALKAAQLAAETKVFEMLATLPAEVASRVLETLKAA